MKFFDFIGIIKERNNFFNFNIEHRINNQGETIFFDFDGLTGNNENDWFLPEAFGGQKRCITIGYRDRQKDELKMYDNRIVHFRFSVDKLNENIDSHGEYKGNIKKKIFWDNIIVKDLSELKLYPIYNVSISEQYSYKDEDLIVNDLNAIDFDAKIILSDGASLFGLYTYTTYQGNECWIPENDGKIFVKPIDSDIIDLYAYPDIRLCKWDKQSTNKDIMPHDIIYNRVFKELNAKQTISSESLELIKKELKDIKSKNLDESRLKLIEDSIKDLSLINKAKNYIEGAISTWIKEEKEGITDIILDLIKNKDKNLWNSLCSSEAIEKEINDLNNKLSERKKELENLKSEISKKNKQVEDLQANLSFQQKNLSSNVANLENQKKSLEEGIDDLKGEYNQLVGRRDQAGDDFRKNSNNLTNVKKELESAQQKLKDVQQELKDKPIEVAKEIVTAINKKLENESSLFNKKEDDYLLRAAVEWNTNIKNKNNDKKYAAVIDSLPTFADNQYNEEGFIKELYDRVRNCGYQCQMQDIINVLICLKTGFLTFLAGEPGSGKTSLCNVVAKCLGLMDFDDDLSKRYISVSVEKGWTSKRDFIGFYNSLTNETISNNQSILNAFYILNKEARLDNIYEKMPFVILLDEANLSMMEYYWGDFMNVADLNSQLREISFPDGSVCKIPASLRFVATINYDHTTEILSNRLIERAWIIKISPQKIKEYNSTRTNESKNMSWMDWSVLSAKDPSVDNTIFNLLSDFNISLSFRNQQMILEYMKYSHLFTYCLGKDDDPTTIAEDFVIAQKILPLISVYGEEFKDKLDILYKNLKGDDPNTTKYPKSAAIVQHMLNADRNKLHRYSFFA